MNSSLQPYPPLEVIEARLFGESASVDAQNAARIDDAPALAAEGASLPDWLQDRIAQIAAQRAQPVPATAAPGQIWSVAYQGEYEGRSFTGRIPMLLDQPLTPGGWQGWLMSDDTDYATRADIILETRELQINPAAAMVQTWNRVAGVLDAQAPYLGQVDADTLAMVRSVANESVPAHAPKGQPCNLDLRDVGGGRYALTGDHLGDARDLRWAYRRLYLKLAQAFAPVIASDQDYDV